MAQINITLNQEEILQLMSNNREDAFRELLEKSLNSILQAESTEQLGAELYQRSSERKDSRNGTRERSLTTRIGKITLKVPRHRNVPFKSLIFDNYSRSESALILAMAEMVVSGVSTRKISNVMETLCGQSYSKSTVSEACKELDEHVESFRKRTLDEEYPFVIVDATYMKVRDNHKIVSKAFMVAIGINERGIKEVIGFEPFQSESKSTWKEFLSSLKARGLKGVKMITSDAHEGILYAISRVFPEVPWQRCQYHFIRNILESAPKKYQQGLRSELQEMFNCKTIEEARQIKTEIYNDYNDIAETAMKCLDEGFDNAMTVMMLPENIRRPLRTSNYLERLNRELKRRSKVIGIFPNTDSLTRLMGAVLIEENQRYQEMSRLFYATDYNKVAYILPKLKQRAKEQQQLLDIA